MTTITARCHWCPTVLDSGRRTFASYEKTIAAKGWRKIYRGNKTFRICPTCAARIDYIAATGDTE